MNEPFENQSMEEEPINVQSFDEQPIAHSEPQAEETQATQTAWEPDPAYVYIPPKKEPRRWPIGAIIAVALVCSLLGGAFGAGGMYLLHEQIDRYEPAESNGPQDDDNTIVIEGIRQNSVIDINQIDTSKLMTQAEVYAANVNSTVGITTSITTTNFWGQQTTSAASGSGFIFSKDGYILTNFHVVDDSSSITVSMYDGKTHKAKLIGYDEGNDVAVLKIEADNLVPVILGNSDNLNVGDSVVAIGNPLGELTFSLTAGSISAKDREITMSTGATMQLMQTDCAINSGNSGGALFNLYGEVIGITNAKYSSSSSSSASIDNIGFAIPINKARAIAESIIEKGYVSKPYIGISPSTVSSESQSFGLPQGAAVRSVATDSPAAEAGLKVNDIITHVNGKQISGSSELTSIVSNSAVGDVLKLIIYRQGQTIERSITVGEQKQSVNNQQNQNQNQSQHSQNPWGY